MNKGYSKLSSITGGFTVVELLVAITLFIVVVSIATGTFIQALRTQRSTVSLLAVNSNISLALEQISREIRTGRSFSVSGGALNFTNAKNQSVFYRLNGQALERVVDGAAGLITSSNVAVAKLDFILSGESSIDGLPTKITVVLRVGAPGTIGSPVNLQTTISSRILEG